MRFHRRNMEEAVREAKGNVEKERQRLNLFIQWTYSREGVCGWELAEYWRRLCGAEQEVGRGWGIVTPPDTPAAPLLSSPVVASLPPPQEVQQEVPQGPSLPSLLADLTRSNRSTTEAEATTSGERVHTWLSNVVEHEVIEPPEIEEIPLSDAPIGDVMIRVIYTREWRDGLDVDVWEEVHGCRVPW
jgi:sarcosine oxidase delta subunit